MNNINKTLYIPLYGKAFVSKCGLFIKDKKAEEIWHAEEFSLKGKSKSKWLAYYMGIRAAVFDGWAREKMAEMPHAAVLHIGCGMDSRAERIGADELGRRWYDIDFPSVIEERRRYFEESELYKMVGGDAKDPATLEGIGGSDAIVIMEGVSMYLSDKDMNELLKSLSSHFERIALLLDCYTPLAARLSKFKNPINDVGVTEVYGIDDPKKLESADFTFLAERNMTPEKLINELKGGERLIFKKLYAGNFSKKLYKLFEYKMITVNKGEPHHS